MEKLAHLRVNYVSIFNFQFQFPISIFNFKFQFLISIFDFQFSILILTNHKSKSKVQVQADDWVFIKIKFSNWSPGRQPSQPGKFQRIKIQ